MQGNRRRDDAHRLLASPPKRGIEVCAPVHDAILILAPLDRLDDDVAAMQRSHARGVGPVLAGFELGTDVKIVRYPDRYSDPRGEVMWRRVMKLIGEPVQEPWEAGVTSAIQPCNVRRA